MIQDKSLLEKLKVYLVYPEPTKEQAKDLIMDEFEKSAIGHRGEYEYIDTRKLTTLEKLAGEDFYQTISGRRNLKEDLAKSYIEYVMIRLKESRCYNADSNY